MQIGDRGLTAQRPLNATEMAEWLADQVFVGSDEDLAGTVEETQTAEVAVGQLPDVEQGEDVAVLPPALHRRRQRVILDVMERSQSPRRAEITLVPGVEAGRDFFRACLEDLLGLL